MKKIFTYIAVFLVIIMPVGFLLAASDSHDVSGGSAKLVNPLKVNSITDLVVLLVKIAAQLGAIVCVFFIIYSGFLFIKAQGKPDDITKAKQVFLWSLVGTAIMLGASVIANVVKGTVESVVGPIN